ncbi:TrmJ/YjtD family RNA methyltransferase [Candidatus Micrarchaeota archaeon]|nr:TrmJ/YjtD family RNA methyltransferase [Candidatus Micrarchaeota archaeon]
MKDIFSRVRVVLVEPEYEMNLGYCARVCANFGFEKLFIVNPKCSIGFVAKKYSKHAVKLLEGARIVKTLSEATQGCEFVVGTSAVLKRGRSVLRNPISPRAFVEKIRNVDGEFALLIGREGTGLSKREIDACDLLVRIPASFKYSTLNVSHALAVLLYELRLVSKPKQVQRSSKAEREKMSELFGEIVDVFAVSLRNPAKIKQAFRRMVGRAVPSDVEAASILGVLRKTKEKLKEKN